MKSRSSRQACVTSDGDVRVRIFFVARDVCFMPRTKFGSNTMLNSSSDTMLNVNIIINAMCYTMLYMLE